MSLQYIVGAVCSILLINLSLFPAAMVMSAHRAEVDWYAMPGLICAVPGSIGKVIENFNQVRANNWVTDMPEKRRVFLYGEPGNGKSEVARGIAALTNSELIELKAAGLVGSLQGSGATNIKQCVDYIIEKEFHNQISSRNHGFVLFIDEIDAIASLDIPGERVDSQNALKMLWMELTDRLETCGNVLFICAANTSERLSQQLLNRFGYKIYMPNPDLAQRTEFLQKYIGYAQAPIYKPALSMTLRFLARISDLLKNEFEGYFNAIQHGLAAIDNELCKEVITQENKKNVQVIIAHTELELTQLKDASDKKYQQLKEASGSSTALPDQFKSVMTRYRDIATSYLKIAKNYAQAGKKQFTDEQLKWLAISTESFPYRSLRYFVNGLYDSTTDDQFFSQQIIEQKFNEAKQDLGRERLAAIEKVLDKKLERESKILNIIDILRKINSTPHHISTKSTTTSNGWNVGFGQGISVKDKRLPVDINLNAQVNLGSSISTTQQLLENKQYPALAELCRNAKLETADSLNNRVLHNLKEAGYLQGIDIVQHIYLCDLWEEFINCEFNNPLTRFLKTFNGAKLATNIEILFQQVALERHLPPKIRIANFFYYAKAYGIIFDQKIIDLFLIDLLPGAELIKTSKNFCKFAKSSANSQEFVPGWKKSQVNAQDSDYYVTKKQTIDLLIKPVSADLLGNEDPFFKLAEKSDTQDLIRSILVKFAADQEDTINKRVITFLVRLCASYPNDQFRIRINTPNNIQIDLV